MEKCQHNKAMYPWACAKISDGNKARKQIGFGHPSYLASRYIKIWIEYFLHFTLQYILANAAKTTSFVIMVYTVIAAKNNPKDPLAQVWPFL